MQKQLKHNIQHVAKKNCAANAADGILQLLLTNRHRHVAKQRPKHLSTSRPIRDRTSRSRGRIRWRCIASVVEHDITLVPCRHVCIQTNRFDEGRIEILLAVGRSRVPPSTTMCLGSTRVFIPNRTSIRSAVFAQPRDKWQTDTKR